jgi:hypothetical protein
MPFTPANLEFAAKWGPAGVIAFVMGYGIWKMFWYIVEKTVPKQMYEDQRKSEILGLTDAVDRNTSTVEKMVVIFNERIPRKGE